MIVAHAFELAARILWAIGFALGDVARGVDRIEVAIATVGDRLCDSGHAAGDIACAVAEVLEDPPAPLDPLELALEHMLGVPDADALIWTASRELADGVYEDLCERLRHRDVYLIGSRGYRRLEEPKRGGRLQVLVLGADTMQGRRPTLEVTV